MSRLAMALTLVAVAAGGLVAQEFLKDPPLVDNTIRLERLVAPALELNQGDVVLELEDIAVPRRIALQRAGIAKPQVVEDHPDMPADAKEMLAGYKTDAEAIRKKADEEIKQRRLRVIDELQKAQDRYTREAKLDEAVAIRDTIRRLKATDLTVLPNPGNLYQFRELEGQALHFQVTGRIGGSIWGSDVYTGDSDLATASVHAGALRVGETGIVEVRIVPSPPQHLGSARNGVTTSNWGTYSFSYTVRKWVGDEKRPMP